MLVQNDVSFFNYIISGEQVSVNGVSFVFTSVKTVYEGRVFG